MTLSDFLRPVSRFALAAGIAGVVGLASPVSVSFAQDAPGATASPHGDRAARRGRHMRRGHRAGHMRRMATELGLSDAQREQIRGIMREAREARGEAAPGERGAHRGQVREQIQAVLTPEQRSRAQELRQEHMRTRIDRRVTHMTERLSLSETQQQQVTGILRNAAMQRRALFEQAQNEPGSARDAMQSLRESTMTSVRSVLNSEQATQLDAMRAQRGERGERGHHGRRGRGHRGR